MHPTVERYLQAALAGVRRRDRGDVRAELHSAINDEVRDRMDAGLDEGTAVETVLEEFGDPLRFAAQYRARPLGLVSAERYPAWRTLVRLLWLILVPATFAVFLVVGVERGESAIAVVGGAAFAALEATVHVGFWTTLSFALADRLSPPTAATEQEVPWSTAYLPQTPPNTVRVTNGEMLLRAGAALLGAAVIALQGVVSPVWSTGEPVPLLAPAGWNFWWPFFITMLVLLAVAVIVARLRGTWNRPLLAVTLTIEAAFVLPMIWLLVSGRALDSRFTDLLDDQAAALGWSLRTSAADLVTVALAVVLGVALAWSAVAAVRIVQRLRRGRVNQPQGMRS